MEIFGLSCFCFPALLLALTHQAESRWLWPFWNNKSFWAEYKSFWAEDEWTFRLGQVNAIENVIISKTNLFFTYDEAKSKCSEFGATLVQDQDVLKAVRLWCTATSFKASAVGWGGKGVRVQGTSKIPFPGSVN